MIDLNLLAVKSGMFKGLTTKTGSIERAQDGEKSDNDKEEEQDHIQEGFIDIDDAPKPKK